MADSTLGRTLVLGADYQPREVCSAEDAIWDVMSQKAEIVEGTGRMCRSPSFEIEVPSVIRQIRYHKPKKQLKPKSLALTPRNVCARDRWVCAYQRPGICKGRATTIDHVVPRSKGGENTWENVVASCAPCNHKKGSKSIAELGWEMKHQPWRPIGPLARVLVQANRPEWIKWFA